MASTDKMKRVGLFLAGCGRKDGSEIHEAICALLAIHQQGAEPVCIAVDQDQETVIDHATGRQLPQRRNMLAEAARIARREIYDIKDVDLRQLDALIFSGGYGASINLSTYAKKGVSADLHPQVRDLILRMHSEGKPMGAICIASVLFALAMKGQKKLILSHGNNTELASHFVAWGMTSEPCDFDDIIVDHANKLVTTPGYIFDRNIAEIFPGISKLVASILQLSTLHGATPSNPQCLFKIK